MEHGKNRAGKFARIVRVSALVGVSMAIGFLASPVLGQEVALTFDDLPAHGPLPPGTTRVDVARSILKALKSANAPAVYGFVNGDKLDKVPEDLEVLKLWKEAGNPLGNHTFSHMNLNANTAEAFEQDIARNEPLLKSLMGADDWRWLRYPYLWEGDTLEKRRAVRAYLKENHYRIAQVTLDFEDYAWNPAYARCSAKDDAKAIAWLKESYLRTADEYIALDQELARMVFGRDIKHVLLLHVGAFDAIILPDLLDHFQKKGFKLITLQEAESDPAYAVDPDAALKFGGTLLEQLVESRGMKYPPHAEKPMKELAAICQEPTAIASH
jgi:peptidoglycan/xylan/chitin deacetylase (PgdA/CDA1 family)